MFSPLCIHKSVCYASDAALRLTFYFMRGRLAHNKKADKALCASTHALLLVLLWLNCYICACLRQEKACKMSGIVVKYKTVKLPVAERRKAGRNEEKMKKTIITVVGKDTVGIIAKVCTYLAENGINILDISQTIVQGYFNMMMIVDTNTMTKQFGDMADELTALGEQIGVVIKCQKEEIFDKMHRI